VTLTKKGRQRFDQIWPEHEKGIGHYFVDPLARRDFDELDRVLGKLIEANENG
jgi:hypothetical protein